MVKQRTGDEGSKGPRRGGGSQTRAGSRGLRGTGPFARYSRGSVQGVARLGAQTSMQGREDSPRRGLTLYVQGDGGLGVAGGTGGIADVLA